MATFTLPQPLYLPILPRATTITAALAPSIFLGGKALPFTRVVVFNPPRNFPSISISSKPYLPPKFRVSSPNSSLPNSCFAAITTTDSTRTIAAIFNLLAHSIQSFLTKIVSITPNPSLAKIRFLREFLVSSVGRLLFAAITHGYRSRRVSTPLTPVAIAISYWLNVYWVMLQIRVILVWFPDTPWDRPPLSVIKDLIDPYLSLIRKFSPPLFNILDVSPFYATVLLEVLSLVLNANLTVNSPYYANLHSHF